MRQAARQRALAANGNAAITKLDEAQNAAVGRARPGRRSSKQRLARMLAALGGDPEMPTDEHPLVREKKAERDRAELDLERTTIKAPIGGTAVNVKLQPGEQVKAATPLFVLVSKTRPWVEANMKETDLTHVKPGQKAAVVLDIYPDVTWSAEVESISPATGAEFAILPPQNASGNWVKVVQRLPVRVRLLPHQGEPPLRAGMTATVTIDINRQRSLAGLLARQRQRRPERRSNTPHATRCSSSAPARRRRMFSIAISRLRSSVSGVSQATCGISATLSSASSGLSGGTGSSAKTSRPAARRWPLVNAATSAASSTSPPRAVLTRIAPGFMRASAAPSIRRSVSGTSGRCSETMSAVASSSSRSTARDAELGMLGA